jgi:hypothetical protein
MSYDKDVDPDNKHTDGFFYGYIPNDAKARVSMFSYMMVFSSCHIVLRAATISMTLAWSAWYFLIFFSVDMGTYLLIKILRKDFRYWLAFNGPMSWVSSLIMRLSMKVIVDITLLIQGRHAFELGGLSWSANLLVGHLSTFTTLYLYLTYSQLSENFVLQIGASSVWYGLAGVECVFLASFSMFMLSMRSNYRQTFYSTTTAVDYCCRCFRVSTNDAATAAVLFYHPTYYRPIQHELKEWIAANWDKWNEEKPDWFDLRFVEAIPLEFIPTVEGKNERDNAAARGVVRRTSIAVLVEARAAAVGDDDAKTRR